MFDFTVRARSGHWVLQDAEAGDLGAYETHDEALAAASDWVRLIEMPWPVLVCDEVLHYAQMVQNIVLVVQWGHTHKEVVVEALNQLAIAGGNVSGVALSKVNRRQYKQYASVDLHYDYSGRGASALST